MRNVRRGGVRGLLAVLVVVLGGGVVVAGASAGAGSSNGAIEVEVHDPDGGSAWQAGDEPRICVRVAGSESCTATATQVGASIQLVVPAGSYEVDVLDGARSAGDSPDERWFGRYDLPVSVVGGDVVPLAVTLDPGGTISGTVRRPNGAPAAADVGCSGRCTPFDGELAYVTTGSDGEFVLRAASGVQGQLVARPLDGLPGGAETAIDVPAPVPPGGDVAVDVDLRPTPELQVVLEQAAEPGVRRLLWFCPSPFVEVAGAPACTARPFGGSGVALVPDAGVNRSNLPAHTMRYAIAEARDDETGEVLARSGLPVAPLVLGPDDAARCTWTLVGTVPCRAVPRTGLFVSVQGPGGSTDWQAAPQVCALTHPAGTVVQCLVADGRGEVVFSLAPGSYRTVAGPASAADGTPWFAAQATVTLEGGRLEPIDLTLDLGTRLQGRVATADGASVGGAEVCFRPDGPPPLPPSCATTDGSGGYELPVGTDVSGVLTVAGPDASGLVQAPPGGSSVRTPFLVGQVATHDLVMRSGTLLDVGGGEQVLVSVPAGATLEQVASIPLASLPPVPDGYAAPVGAVSFEVHGLAPGGAVDVVLDLPEGSWPVGYLKQLGAGWVVFEQALVVGDTITLSLVDGGAGDADGIADGTIVDPGAPVADVVPTFLDVAPSHPFFADIQWMAQQGISTGYPPGPTYRPSASVTRAAMSAFMYRLAGSPSFADPVSPTFGDVSESHPFSSEVEWMASEGITTGTAASPKPLYKPGSAVSRQAMSAFMHRLADGPGVAPGLAG